ncbi:MAG: hypothetical protein WC342_06150 [Methanoregula sp.]|jgi:hypothetical protein
MSNKSLTCTLVVLLLVSLFAAGCVTPPKGSASTTGGSKTTTVTTVSETNATSTLSYVSEETPFGADSEGSTDGDAGITPLGYHTYATQTPFPEDLSCLIYVNTQYFSSNTTAISFDLKNPPMYLNYTVVPFNITVNKYVKSRSGSNNYITLTYSDYSPYSWFEITVLDKKTGETIQQGGFGTAKGYGIYKSATLGPILRSGDLQVQMRGNQITATTGIWVKPLGNFDNPENKTFAECKYWGPVRNTLPVVSATTTPAWTPENQVKE